MGAWTPASYNSRQEYSTFDAAWLAAKEAVPWLASLAELGRNRGSV